MDPEMEWYTSATYQKFGIDPRRKYLLDEDADWLCKTIKDWQGIDSILHSLRELCDDHDETDTIANGNSRNRHTLFFNTGNNVFEEAIEWMISQNYDFGRAYAVVSAVFVKVSLEAGQEIKPSNLMQDVMDAVAWREKERDRIHIPNTQSEAAEFISSPYETLPRRIWDIRSNRVIPFWLLMIKSIWQHSNSEAWVVEFHDVQVREFWAVSHSWAEKTDSIWTPANNEEWAVPLPCGVPLDRIRKQLITFGANHVWLDVLCLRQDGGPRRNPDIIYEDKYLEDERHTLEEEWRLDVPTIGNVYRMATRIIRYFNGLGCRFSLNGWDGQRHWLQRAWTLQELKSEDKTYNGGVDGGLNLWNTKGKFDKTELTTLREVMVPLWELVEHLEANVSSGHAKIYHLAREMRRRHASHELDKICGLFYLLRPQTLPVYQRNTPPEEAWLKCSHVLPEQTQLELFFDFPYPHKNGKWFPSWEQVLDWPRRNLNLQRNTIEATMRNNEDFADCSHLKDIEIHRGRVLMVGDVWVLPNVTIQRQSTITGPEVTEYTVQTCEIAGSAAVSASRGHRRPRLVQPKDIHFHNIYDQQEAIPGGHYFLVTPEPSTARNWVVCKPVWPLRLEIQSTPSMSCEGECIQRINGPIFKKIGVLRTDFVASLTGPDSTLEHHPLWLCI